MRSNKTPHLPGSRTMAVTALCFLLGSAAFAHGADDATANALRHRKGRTIISEGFPKAQFSIGKEFRFIGMQRVNLLGNAEAEQYVFARPGRDNVAEQFYLIQFEHFFPTNNFTYDYASMPAIQMGNLPFNYDVKSFPDLGPLLMEEKSDGAALEQLLAKRHLSLPHYTAIVRMFHLPSADRRMELMIIYGEALPPDTAVPVRKGGVPLDKESPGSAQIFLEHARRGLVIQTR